MRKRDGNWILMVWAAMLALHIAVGCGASPTAPDTIEGTPWIGHYASEPTLYPTSGDSILVMGSINIYADSTCDMRLAFSADDASASVESTLCTYSIHGLQAGSPAVLLEGEVWVEFDEVAGPDEMRFWVYPVDAEWSAVRWLVYLNQPSLILVRS